MLFGLNLFSVFVSFRWYWDFLGFFFTFNCWRIGKQDYHIRLRTQVASGGESGRCPIHTLVDKWTHTHTHLHRRLNASPIPASGLIGVDTLMSSDACLPMQISRPAAFRGAESVAAVVGGGPFFSRRTPNSSSSIHSPPRQCRNAFSRTHLVEEPGSGRSDWAWKTCCHNAKKHGEG